MAQSLEQLPSLLLDENGEYEHEHIIAAKLAKTRRHTASYLHRFKPHIYKLIVRMLAESLPVNWISEVAHVNHQTVEAVRNRENVPIEIEKERLLTSTKSAVRLCIERLIELAPTMNAKEASLAFSIAAEKMQLLAGEATHIIAKEDAITHAKFNDMIASLPQAHAHTVSETDVNNGQKMDRTKRKRAELPPIPAESSKSETKG